MTGIFIIARLGSKRLEKKHLISTGSQTFLDILIQRILFRFQEEISTGSVRLMIVTSDEAFNREFEVYANTYPLDIYYGNKSNIPLRIKECAEQFNCERVISVDGDDILCSVAAMERVNYDLMRGEKVVKTVGLPLGMNVIGFQLRNLTAYLEKYGVLDVFETGWGRIFPEEDVKEIIMEEGNIFNQKLRFTLDYNEDAAFFKELTNRLGARLKSASDIDIITCAEKDELYSINSKMNDIYWENFNTEKAKEN